MQSNIFSRWRRWAVVGLALVAMPAGACGGASGAGAGSPGSDAPAGAGSSAKTSLPKKCAERVPESAVSTAVGQTVQLSSDGLIENFSLGCTYEVMAADTGNVNIGYFLKDHVPSRSELNDHVFLYQKAFGGEIQPVTGVGDSAGWLVGTMGAVESQHVWTLVAAKGMLLVTFTIASQVAQTDKARMSEVVRKALG